MNFDKQNHPTPTPPQNGRSTVLGRGSKKAGMGFDQQAATGFNTGSDFQYSQARCPGDGKEGKIPRGSVGLRETRYLHSKIK
jgi:hypothetical protein